ncbi:DUF4221 family protein [Hugenholtzia roseola]|uniref:DUF4221 family protein n=1 Tax=Hugenholtzia roseola TaxID=1002 RepID=UPI000427AA4C|nr:DUF4221 family protein [Hugenholtzia roseola]
MKQILTIFFLLLWICACQTSEEASLSHTLHPIDTVDIALDSLSALSGFDFVVPESDSLPYLNTYNTKLHAFETYSITEKKLIKRTFLAKEGQNAILPVSDWYFHTQDSIFCLNEMLPYLFLLDGEGKIRNKWDLTAQLQVAPDDAYTIAGSESVTNNLYYDKNNKTLYFFILSDTKEFQEFYKSYIQASFQIESKKLTFQKYPPKHYQESCCYPIDAYDFIKKGDSLIYAFAFSNSIEIKTQKKENIKPFFISNETIKKPIFNTEVQTMFNFLIETPYGRGLWYDKQNKRFYRAVKHKQPLKNATGKLNGYADAAFALLIGDENFNKIAQVEFPEKSYDLHSSFTYQGNFWIALYSEIVEREGTMRFVIFQTIKK